MERLPGYLIDRILTIVGLGLIVFLYWKMGPYPEEARVMPGALLVACGLLLVILGFQAFVLKTNRAKSLYGVPILKVILILISIIIYYFFIMKLGFYLSSWLFFLVTVTWINPEKSKKKLVYSWLCGTFFVLFLYFLFGVLLKVPLPGGAFG